MRKTDKTGPSGEPLWEYEIEFNEDEEVYVVPDINWSLVEYQKGRGLTKQVFTGRDALEKQLDDNENWKFDYNSHKTFVYQHKGNKDWFIYFDTDEVGACLGGVELKEMSEHDLEAWLHCMEADSPEKLVEIEKDDTETVDYPAMI